MVDDGGWCCSPLAPHTHHKSRSRLPQAPRSQMTEARETASLRTVRMAPALHFADTSRASGQLPLVYSRS